MTEQNWACVATLGMVLVFWCVCIYLYAKHLKPSESFLQRFDSGWEKIRQAQIAAEYFYAFVISMFFLFKGSLKPFMAATTLFVSLVIVGNSPCTPSDSLFAQFLRDAWETFFLPWLEYLSPNHGVKPPQLKLSEHILSGHSEPYLSWLTAQARVKWTWVLLQ